MNLPFRALRRWSACLAGLVTVLPSGLAAKTWTDRGPEFRAGTLGNAGQNLQVNRHGAIETIRRYDVDGDGRIDLLSNSGHDMYYALPAALVRAGAGGALQVDELRVDGSSRVVPADLNRDGFMDLVFLPNVSNVQYAHRASLRIAWGRADGWSSSRITRQLPVNGGFGAEDSWLPKARVAVGDLNGDGWPDIVTLNSEGWLFGQPAGRIVRTYWGGAEGPYLGQYHELGVAGALELATGGFGARREHPAVVLTAAGELHYLGPDAAGKGVAVVRRVPLPLSPAAGSAPVKVQCLAVQPGTGGAGDVLWIGTDSDLVFRVGPGATAGEIRAIPARPATHLAVGRLDDDAFPDLVLTNLKLVFRTELTRASHVAPVEILWGTADGVDVRGAASLKVLNAISATIGDLNADGHGDLLVSVHQGDVTMQASSRVYFGDGSRRLPAEGRPVPTEGAQEAVITRVTPDSPPVAVIANSMSYTLDAAVPALLYWGGEKGFSPDDKVEIPNLGGLKSSLSDLNGDGHVDLVIINGGDVTPAAIARAPHVGANIYWGGPEGPIGHRGPTRFDPARRQILREPFLCSINVADFNADGMLDLVLGTYESPDNPETDMIVYYGTPSGFDESHRQKVHVPSRSFGLAIADYDRDRWLDLAIVGYANDLVTLYRGGPDGFTDQRKRTLRYPAPIELETADLNADGWLDLVVSSYYDPVTQKRDTGLSIFWGDPRGWTLDNSQWLPGLSAQAMGVADLDRDGFLDLVLPNYHGELTREHLPSYIYWGSAAGYSTRQRTLLTVDSAVDVMIADYDGDGRLDLAFTAHSVDAGHRVSSPVYFNDGRRFESPRVQYLPVIGPFYSWEQDPGNIYTRRFEEEFTSRVLAWSAPAGRGSIRVDAATPFGSQAEVQVRSAPDAAALEKAAWRAVDAGRFTLGAADRALQYRLLLKSANGDAYPVVRQVDVGVE